MEVNNINKTLYALLRSAFFNYDLDVTAVRELSTDEWESVFILSKKQGVRAIVAEVLDRVPNDTGLSGALRLQWASATIGVEKWYAKQYAVAADFAGYMADNNIKTLVLKGIAYSTYYPVPSHRECGDLDCFLGQDYEKGNVLAEKSGAHVSRDYYKHSHIKYKGLDIENHQFCLGIRGNKLMKDFERHLRGIAFKHGTNYIGDTKLIKPSVDFDALFLTAHGMTHFVTEGIKLRHICDWALLLDKEQNNIDWDSFYDWCDALHYTRFANAMTDIAVRYLGLKLTNPSLRTDSRYSERILEDCYLTQGLFNKGYAPWRSRIQSILMRVKSIWKFHLIYRKSLIELLARQIYGFFFELHPRL